MNSHQSRIHQLLEELESLLKHMDVPVWKRDKTCWLRDNLEKRNSSHPKFKEAMEKIEELISHGVAHK